MSSVIQHLLQKYKKQVEKYEHWPSHYEEHKTSRLEKVAECFMSIIVLLCCSDERAQKIQDKTLKLNANDLYEAVSKDRKISINFLKRVVGQYISDEFTTNLNLLGLKH